MLKKNREKFIIGAIALIHLCLTFITDKNIFTASFKDNPSDYIICKLITYVVLYAFYYGIYTVLFSKNRKESLLCNTLKWALPYLPVVLIVSFIKLKSGFLSNDENLIYENAINLIHYTWFYYITTYYYIVSLMLIPFKYSPIIIKLIIELLVIGYVTFRISRIFSKKAGCFSYILFLLYPVIAYTTSAHRLPIYFFVYLYLFSTLLFDLLENKDLSLKRELWLIFVSAILTQWRTEGIYLVVLTTILLFMVYGLHKDKKRALLTIGCVLLCQYLVSVPQNGFIAKELGAAADDRMKPFYAYTVTNMFRNGLDREKNSQTIDIIDKYLSVEKIDAINDYYKDINYEDVLILYKEGFIGVREEATLTDYFNFANACKELFKNNPDVFLKTRWGAFKYAALPYHFTFTGTDIRSLISFGISVVKTILYNLFIPVIIIICILFYSLFKRNRFNFFVMGGLLCHLFIVFILAPASYFKYYFPIYIMGYFYLMLFIIQAFFKEDKKIPDKDISLQTSVKERSEYGHIVINATTEELLDRGFEYGDTVNINFENGTRLEDIPFYNGFYSEHGGLLLVAYPGIDNPSIGVNFGRFYDNGDFKEGLKIDILLNKKGGASLIQNINNLVYTNKREDYSSDDEFANARDMKGGKLKPFILHRSASPFDDTFSRAGYASEYARKNNIKVILDLADSREDIDNYRDIPEYSRKLIDEGGVIFAKVPADYSAKEFADNLAKGLTTMSQKDGPYLINCLEGKDRTGFVCALLDALATSGYDEIVDDYMSTYQYYYGITKKDTETYDYVVTHQIDTMLRFMVGEGKDIKLSGEEMEKVAISYLLGIGMKEENILTLRKKMTE
ncbi:MAG: tyrosine-protein phosphatase [Lachnospiraceae bacterium]|nr:tyrosine-protein phosphatase [Lachnospiraceae bacterium]